MNSTKSGNLNYYLPKPTKPHTLLHVPGSHTLYVGPLSCTRRHVVNAMKYANREDISCLFITQGDVISGRYEDLIVESIGKLNRCLAPVPHVFLIACFCIDDFLGTDEGALLERLQATYPDQQFAIQHIDPVSMDERASMGIKRGSTLYSFLKPAAEHDRGINFLGNYVSLPDDCEFRELLASWGYGPIREIFSLKTYEEYQTMAQSALNIVLRFMHDSSAEMMQTKLNIPYYTFYTSYDPERIEQGYRDIAALLKVELPDLNAQREAAIADIHETVRLLDGMVVAIDSSASIPTFQTARALLKYGFNLKYIFRSNRAFQIDPEDADYILKERKDVQVTRASAYVNLVHTDTQPECMAIGSDCARVLRASHYVDLWHDEGYFGFQGVHRLMHDIRDAFYQRTDWDRVPELKLKTKTEG